MAAQGAPRHFTAEPAPVANKRERRRGAAGRAAVLRRAPSDSDCSGETASLSADSGDRAPRPLPPTTRTAKSRSSRRRGSEWEVLEGLKDGQRFEKRPEVFNGYLHKKRKWPLKGWHKRFFVIDGGILVYARSPTDVARGRLHGSVDVGLSVISAKQRRRRIDIDADEFIYHLRAKTPDLFRTWLLVLKAHRLYRQHLLTFGTRESAPKIHVPLEDLPANDTSRTPFSILTPDEDTPSPGTNPDSTSAHTNSVASPKWATGSPADEVKMEISNHDQLMQLHKLYMAGEVDIYGSESPTVRHDALETHIHAPDMKVYSLHVRRQKHACNAPCTVHNEQPPRNKCEKSSSQSDEEARVYKMKKSKKCTNLVFFKNAKDEPKLARPLSKCMLLGKHHLRVSKDSFHKYETKFSPPRSKTMLLGKHHLKASKDSFNSKTLVKVGASMKYPRDGEVRELATESCPDNILNSASEYDKITEKLLVTIFGKNRNTRDDNEFVLSFVKQAVKEIYDVKMTQQVHPIKQLFKCLLQYWLLNTSVSSYRDAMQHAQSISSPSMKHFTKDANLSGVIINRPTKATQFHGLSEIMKTTETKPPISNSFDYFDKERRIQELERIMKNTVYTCEIPHLDAMSRKQNLTSIKTEKSNYGTSSSCNMTITSSSDFPKLQQTLHRLMNDYTVPTKVANDFLNAYLDILMTKSFDHSENSADDRELSRLLDNTFSQNKCASVRDVSTTISKEDSITKSQSIQNVAPPDLFDLKVGPSEVQFVDNAEQYVPLDAGFALIEKITAVFNKIYKKTELSVDKSKSLLDPVENDLEPKDDKDNKCTECENILKLNLCHYSLHDIFIAKDPASEAHVSITVLLRDKTLDEEFKNSKKDSTEDLKSANPTLTDEWMLNLSILQPKTQCDRISFDTVFGDSQDHISLPSERSELQISTPSQHSNDNSFQSSNYFKPANSNNKCANEFKINNSEGLKQCRVTSGLKNKMIETANLAKKIIVKDRTKLSSTAKGDVARQEQLAASVKSNPKMINEQLILLLLENLTLLSQNVPWMHKEVGTLNERLNEIYGKKDNAGQGIHSLDDKIICSIYKNKLEGNLAAKKTKVNLHRDDNEITKNAEAKHLKTDNKAGITSKMADQSLMACAAMENKTTDFKDETSYCLDKSATLSDDALKIQSSPDSADDDDQSLLSSFTPRSDTSKSKKKTRPEKTSATERANTRRVHKANVTTANFQPPEKRAKEPTLPTKSDNLKLPRRTIQSKPTTTVSSKNARMLIRIPKSLNKGREYLTREATKHSMNFVPKERKLSPKQKAVYEVLCNRKASQCQSRSGSRLLVRKVSSEDLKTIYRCKSVPSCCSGLASPTSVRGPQAGFVSGTPGGTLASWIIESGGPLENASKELGQAQLSVQQLQRLLDALELQQQVHHDTDVSLEGASPNVKKDRRKFGLRKKKSNSKCASVELQPPQYMDPSNSHMALSALTAPPSPGAGASSAPNSAASLPIACAAARPQSLPGAEALGGAGPASLSSLTPDHQLREDFTLLAKDLLANLKSVVQTLVCERGRLRAAMDAADTTSSPGGAVVAALRTNLSSALQQNSELRSRLSRIHDASDLAEISSVGHNSDPQQVSKHLQQSLSYSSSCVSASEFFDAEEHDPPAENEPNAPDEAGVIELDGDSSSEVGSLSSEDGASASSDNSDGALLSAEPVTLRLNSNGMGSSTESRTVGWTRRKRLPCPRPTPGGPSLWNLLYKNIGKDLSQISMPVTINEPLNMLQRLCEELEYSELLDCAAECAAPLERTALVCAFAVSAYASSAHRAASKPFNPLLAETYECLRDDKDFRFVSEQVSHHPPISACHAESPRWCFWQEARIKTKFWGKSMEFQPAGRVHVRLLTTGDHYSWNKVTTCVHNLFGGQRWVDQYGDMLLTCHGTDISAKLNFVKASPWSTSRHEVRGAVTQSGTGARLRLQGRWSEALHAGEPPAARCLWRPGAMPPEHELYYGFTRFAMELNELEPGMKELLPHTDTRLRPDQRALEEGDVEAAEQYKHRLEQSQRERRRDSPEHTPRWFRKSQEGGEEMWVFNGEYWKAREVGFTEDAAPRIW